mgnify:CR=1 FL=1
MVFCEYATSIAGDRTTDVDLSLKNLAETLGIDAQAALDEVMAMSRKRSTAECQARRA